MNPASIANGVILAENDPILRGIIRAMLSRAEQLVFPAADGVDAVMLARRFTARLVLLDVGMPRLNGLLACEAIHGLPGYQDVPIVLLSGSCDEKLRIAGRRLGAREVISKPFTPTSLLARLAPYLNIPTAGLPLAAADADDIAPSGRAEVWATASWGTDTRRPEGSPGSHPDTGNDARAAPHASLNISDTAPAP